MSSVPHGGYPDPPTERPLDALRDSGLLWLINRVVFHPRGFALALHYRGDRAVGWSLQGDGSEAWRYGLSDDEERELFTRVEATLRSASERPQAWRSDASD